MSSRKVSIPDHYYGWTVSGHRHASVLWLVDLLRKLEVYDVAKQDDFVYNARRYSRISYKRGLVR